MTPTETAAFLRNYNDWRRGDEDIPQPDPRVIGEAIDAAVEMIDRLEAAESEALEEARLNGMGGEREAALMAKLEAAEKERNLLKAKVAEMEKQKPVAWTKRLALESVGRGTLGFHACGGNQWGEKGVPLYTLPGAQPTPSVPEGWMRAIDEALVVAHLGVADESDTYEQAKAKLDNLLGFNVDIATDPAVNGGYKLMPIEPTPEMLKAGQAEWLDCAGADPSWDVYQAMVKAAPEVKT